MRGWEGGHGGAEVLGVAGRAVMVDLRGVWSWWMSGVTRGGGVGRALPASMASLRHSGVMTNPRKRGRAQEAAPPAQARKVPGAELLSAAQAAVGAAQTAAGQAIDAAQQTAGYAFDAAVRLPPASAQLAAQLPDLVENLSIAVDRLNSTIDRLDRTLALADPVFATYDRLLPRLEAVISLGEDVFGAVAKLPGVGLLGRITGRGGEEPAPEPEPDKRGRRRR